jgi:hypothetical protein
MTGRYVVRGIESAGRFSTYDQYDTPNDHYSVLPPSDASALAGLRHLERRNEAQNSSIKARH